MSREGSQTRSTPRSVHVLTWPGLSSHPFDEAVLHYQTESNETRALNDAELVDAALVLMGTWLARSFSLDEIAAISTTPGPADCESTEPEVIARIVLHLASQPRYAQLVLPLICTNESPPEPTPAAMPQEPTRIQVHNLALPTPTARVPGRLLGR